MPLCAMQSSRSMNLACPDCGGTRFFANEVWSAELPCTFEMGDDGVVEIDIEPQSEFVKENATSTVSFYRCAGCDFVIKPAEVLQPGILKLSG